MRIPRLYQDRPLDEGQVVELDAAAYRHAVRVLRLGPGAPVALFNGRGGAFEARLLSVDRRRAQVKLERFLPGERESSLHVVLVQGVARGERMDLTLQKAVELGVRAVQPVITRRSSATGSRAEGRMRHWQAVMVSACEQCGRNRLPVLDEPCALEDWLARPATGLRLVLDPADGARLRELTAPRDAPVALVVGPEGGLDADERTQARDAGCVPLKLGPRILRTETAALAGLAAIQALWGDLG